MRVAAIESTRHSRMSSAADCSEPVIDMAAFLSCTVEIHALELGIVAGAYIAFAVVLGYYRFALVASGGMIVAALGVLRVHPVISMKPWYFSIPAVGIPWIAFGLLYATRSIEVDGAFARGLRRAESRLESFLTRKPVAVGLVIVFVQLVAVPFVMGTTNFLVFGRSPVGPMLDYWGAVISLVL